MSSCCDTGFNVFGEVKGHSSHLTPNSVIDSVVNECVSANLGVASTILLADVLTTAERYSPSTFLAHLPQYRVCYEQLVFSTTLHSCLDRNSPIQEIVSLNVCGICGGMSQAL